MPTHSDGPLTRERIVDAALRISDAESNLSQLTVRRLAKELGVGTMTLYSYFRAKDDILDAMADEILGRVELEETGDPEGQETAMRVVAQAFLTTMRQHPVVIRLFAERVTDSQLALRGGMEQILRRLVDSGLPGPLAVRYYSFVVTFTLGFVTYGMPRRWAREDDGEAAELRRQRTHFYAGLPMDEFPVVVRLASELVDLPADWQYWTVVDAVIDNTMRQLKAAPSSKKRPR